MYREMVTITSMLVMIMQWCDNDGDCDDTGNEGGDNGDGSDDNHDEGCGDDGDADEDNTGDNDDNELPKYNTSSIHPWSFLVEYLNFRIGSSDIKVE
ncbi:hypothetical protein PoB_001727200 [Plakobranchus ocellatus]|uniref:Uncharacterized protein n=1 Tax=Plakobranchus ocellatus TaxID=259542 RepID=A0AAV3Z668_9GAST|nr:hypothetical protein PoB_001727200 [Plakobranchus ocellatus]